MLQHVFLCLCWETSSVFIGGVELCQISQSTLLTELFCSTQQGQFHVLRGLRLQHFGVPLRKKEGEVTNKKLGGWYWRGPAHTRGKGRIQTPSCARTWSRLASYFAPPPAAARVRQTAWGPPGTLSSLSSAGLCTCTCICPSLRGWHLLSKTWLQGSAVSESPLWLPTNASILCFHVL